MKIFNDFDLTQFNSYRINSSCKKAYFPESEEEVIELYNLKIPFITIGSGHNIILSKSYYDTNFLIFNGNFNHIQLDSKTNIICAEAGIFMQELSEVALSNSLSGLEIFYDIPSSLGGAVVMNAGASGEEIKDLILKVRYLDLSDFKIKELLNKDLEFEFRNSFFQKNSNNIVLKTWLKLKTGDKFSIKNKMETIKKQRWNKQPKEYPNAGSVFKRPKGYYVGELIENLGLKGFSIGGAKIPEKHAGFIINSNNATGKDIIAIIKKVKEKVLNKYNIDLEVEQRII